MLSMAERERQGTGVLAIPSFNQQSVYKEGRRVS